MNMLSEVGRRPMVGNNENSLGDDLENDLGFLLRDHRRQQQQQEDADDRENELNIYRSGSAPPTVEGSLNAVSGLFNHGGGSNLGSAFAEFSRNKNGDLSEEELRSHPAYSSYYYSNVNMNPRLPPPMLSKEDWRSSQRLQGGSSAIGDRRKVNRSDSGRMPNSMPPGFNSKKQESGGENEKLHLQQGSSVEWGGDGLIGLPGLGLGLGNKQKSLAEMLQDDMNRGSPVNSGHPSRPASRNAFDDNSSPLVEPASYSYAAALGASLSRSTTPDAQRIARAPSPSLTPIGAGRVANAEKRNNINSPNNNNNNSFNESADAVAAALSGMNLSSNGGDQSNNFPSRIEEEVEDHQNYLFSRQTGQNSSTNQQRSYNIKKHETGQQQFNVSPVLPPYQHFDSPTSSFSNYGMGGGYPMSPIAGQMGGSNYPPLFENAAAAAAAAMAVPPMNLTDQSRTMMGNQFVDPLYLQYLRAAEYPQQVSALNESAYVDLLQKAYMVNNLLTPQKSQFHLGGKSGGSSPHGYYGNPAFGISYPGSPLANPMSPVGRHAADFNMRFGGGGGGGGGGMRNMAGSGVIGPWHLDSMDSHFASSLLEEFKSNKARCFELAEIVGHVVEFSADQYGSRFIQQKLETASIDEKNMVFQEIFPESLTLMTDVFGNYVIQKFFEHGMPSQRRELANKLFGHVLTLSLQMYGCRVIQKAIEVVDVDQKIQMVGELDGHVMRCVRDQNGNHVIQKCIECVPEGNIHFIVSTFFDQVVTLATHPYGCRVIQRVLEHCEDENTQRKVMEEILGSVSMLAQDQYGNYVVQHVMEHGKPHERSTIIRELAGNIVQMSQQKFASNVVEKCLTFGDQNERQFLVNEMLGTTDENEPLQAMMKDQFANYVVQKVLETCSDQQREHIMSRIKVHLNALKKYTYGKHIVARVEKLLAAGERRTAAQSQYAAA